MKKQPILWLWIAVLTAPQVSAVEVTFSFPLELERLECGGLLACILVPPDPASIILTLDLTDPLQDQPFTQDDATLGAFLAPFPTTSFFNRSVIEFPIGGTGAAYQVAGQYEYDSLTGRATATIVDYGYFDAVSNGSIDPGSWAYSSTSNYEGRPLGLPAAATALVGPLVPLPPAILFLVSGLFGLMVKRRRR